MLSAVQKPQALRTGGRAVVRETLPFATFPIPAARPAIPAQKRSRPSTVLPELSTKTQLRP